MKAAVVNQVAALYKAQWCFQNLRSDVTVHARVIVVESLTNAVGKETSLNLEILGSKVTSLIVRASIII